MLRHGPALVLRHGQLAGPAVSRRAGGALRQDGGAARPPRRAGAQFNSFVEISTDFSIEFSTEFLVLQAVPHYYKNSAENC